QHDAVRSGGTREHADHIRYRWRCQLLHSCHHGGSDTGEGFPGDLTDQLVLPAEVAVERARRDARLRYQIGHRCLMEPVTGEATARGIDDGGAVRRAPLVTDPGHTPMLSERTFTLTRASRPRSFYGEYSFALRGVSWMRERTTCVVVGGGPAGMFLGLLLARAGVMVTVLERHGDFLRDFRGDTVHISTLNLLDELGLGERFAALPQQWSEHGS